jgi:hypothetical protein
MILAAVLMAAMGGSTAMPAPASVPASCPASVVERWTGSTNTQYPFLRVAPTLTGMTMEMQTGTIGAPGSAYAPMTTAGATVVWHNTGRTVTIAAMRLDGTRHFNVVMPALEGGRPLAFPDAGCWKLHVTSGLKTGDLVLWVAP